MTFACWRNEVANPGGYDGVGMKGFTELRIQEYLYADQSRDKHYTD